MIGTIALAVAVSVAVSQLPSYGELQRRDGLGQMVRVRASDGTIIQTQGPSYGEWLTYDKIPPIMRDAMVAVEDRRFRSHPGVDPIGVVRALWIRVTEGSWRQGGSTITQQLARNILRTNDRSFGRKVREGIVALALEWRFSKDQILELYLNRVYFGGGAYGIDSASRLFYGHSAERLSIAEASIIAGMVKAPSNYSPTADAEAARGRAGVVIDLMIRNGTITPAQAAASNPAELRFAAPSRQVNFTRYFTDWVLPQLDMLIDEAVQPIDVWTTLDLNMQRAGVRAINAHAPGNAQGALGLDRPGRGGQGDGRRPRLRQFELQPRHPGGAPAGLVVQALRLSDRDRGGLPARQPGQRRADHDQRLEPAQQLRPLCRAGFGPPGLRAFDQHGRGAPRPGNRHPRGRRHGAALRHHHPDRYQPLDGARLLRRSA